MKSHPLLLNFAVITAGALVQAAVVVAYFLLFEA
jgi:hypothetical protein